MRDRKAKMTELTAVRLSKELSEEVEEWRATLRPIPSKGEAIRRLLEEALALHKLRPANKAAKKKSEG
jgi:Arc/MetJ-type ribon-helix-helix transcriptional regulator